MTIAMLAALGVAGTGMAGSGRAAPAQPRPAAPAPATTGANVWTGTYLDGVQRFTLHANSNGVDYDIWVSLPPGYDREKRAYPLLVQLDGQSQFALAATAARLVHSDSLVDDMIVVGVAAAGPAIRHQAQRLYDYTPDNVPASVKARMVPYLEKGFKAQGMSDAEWTALDTSGIYGGAPKFLAFLEKQLLPTLKGRYRVDTATMGLSGHSVGGAFVSYALLMGSSFNRYSIGSYTSDWYGDRIPALIDAFAKMPDRRDIRVYEAHGDYELTQLASLGGGQAALDRALNLLDATATARPGLVTVTHRVIADAGHSGMVPAQITGGIRILFGPAAPKAP
ncbi:alpha/beta hydrolase [Sphingobium sp.]|uniref:alpha/beta hydrolase n=1 Tax=Sphingobium sp. TaxID=1912891 RepID=UPI003B3A5196